MIIYLEGRKGIKVLENKILRRTIVSNKADNKEWRKFHNIKINYLYHSYNIIRFIKSIRF